MLLLYRLQYRTAILNASKWHRHLSCFLALKAVNERMLGFTFIKLLNKKGVHCLCSVLLLQDNGGIKFGFSILATLLGRVDLRQLFELLIPDLTLGEVLHVH